MIYQYLYLKRDEIIYKWKIERCDDTEKRTQYTNEYRNVEQQLEHIFNSQKETNKFKNYAAKIFLEYADNFISAIECELEDYEKEYFEAKLVKLWDQYDTIEKCCKELVAEEQNLME